MDKKLERNNKNKVLRLLAHHLHQYAYARTKPTIFTRLRGPVVEFVHLHKFTFAAGFRAHLGIRVVNETRAAVALNGPSSDEIAEAGTDQRKYSFCYDESPESIHRCAGEILDFVRNFAEPWFEQWKDPSILISGLNSPLAPDAKIALQRALAVNGSVNDTAITRRFFNVP